MKLNMTSEYAIKVLSFMVQSDEQLFSSKKLSQELEIPYKYLTKIMSNLTKAGLLYSQRGRDGGVYINKDLEEITIKSILIAVNDYDDKSCILGNGVCNDSKKCILHDRWSVPKKQIDSEFMSITLAQIQNDKIVK